MRMGILKQLIDFFKSLFAERTADTPQKKQLRKLESQLRQMQPPLYKKGDLLPAFGELIFLLYTHTTPFFKLLGFMSKAEGMQIKNRMYDMLIQTGYSDDDKAKLEMFAYEKRKTKLAQSANIQREVESQNHTLEQLFKVLRTAPFTQIEGTLKNLELFYDLCRFNFIPLLKLFNPEFSSLDPQNRFNPVPIKETASVLQELYYVSSAVRIDASLARALTAIASAGSGGKSLTQEQVITHLKKLAGVLTKVLDAETLKICIAIAKEDSEIRPESASVKSTPLSDYVTRMRTKFHAEEQRIKVELQDQRLERETKELFGDFPIVPMASYNDENNVVLKKDSAVSFLWVNPLQIIKTFLSRYFEDKIRALLNDIILEGFFTDPEKKTEFSTTVYACNDSDRVLSAFEQSFQRGEKNDMVLIRSYVNDGLKDPEFARNLATMVNNANTEAKELVQMLVTHFYDLYRFILVLVEDARSSEPEVVSNLKFLFTSSRNRSNVDFLESSLPKWAEFLLLMKNYAVIGPVEFPRKEKS